MPEIRCERARNALFGNPKAYIVSLVLLLTTACLPEDWEVGDPTPTPETESSTTPSPTPGSTGDDDSALDTTKPVGDDDSSSNSPTPAGDDDTGAATSPTPAGDDDTETTPPPTPIGDDDTSTPPPTATPSGDDDTIPASPSPPDETLPPTPTPATPTPATPTPATPTPATPTPATPTPATPTPPTPTPATPTPATPTPATPTPATPTPTTPTPPAGEVVTLEVLPSIAQIDLSSTLSYSARAWDRSGTEVETDGLTWSSSAPNIATIDTSGLLEAVEEGSTTITASLGYIEATAALEVIEDGQIRVRVVDAETLAPVADAEVYRGMKTSKAFVTDENGEVIVSGSFSGRQTLTAFHPDYFWASVVDVLSREVVIPIRNVARAEEGRFSGTADFSQMGSLGWNEARIGLVIRSFLGSPLGLDTTTIIGKNRDVDICGATVEMPSNIVAKLPANCSSSGSLESWSVPGPTGLYDAYMLAGDVPMETILRWVADTSIFENIGKLMADIPNPDAFAYEYERDIAVEAPDDTSGLVVVPDGATDVPLLVDIPIVPEGVTEDYPPAAIAMVDMGDDGFLPIGIAGGKSGETASVYHAEEFSDSPLLAVALAAENGVGAEGPFAVVMGYQESPQQAIVLPSFMDLIEVDQIDYTTTTYTFFPVDDVDVYRSVFTWRFKEYVEENGETTTIVHNVYWDVYQPPDSSVVQVPDIPPRPRDVYNYLDFSSVHWELIGYDNGDWTYDLFTLEPSVNLYDSSRFIERISRNLTKNIHK